MFVVSCRQKKNWTKKTLPKTQPTFQGISKTSDIWAAAEHGGSLKASFMRQEFGLTREVNTGMEEQDWFGYNLRSLQRAVMKWGLFLLLLILTTKAQKNPGIGLVCHSSFLVQDAPKYLLPPGKQSMQNGNRETWGNGGNSEARKGRSTWQVTTKQVQALGNVYVGQQLHRTTENVAATSCKYQAWLWLLWSVIASYTFFSKRPCCLQRAATSKIGFFANTYLSPRWLRGSIFSWFGTGVPSKCQVQSNHPCSSSLGDKLLLGYRRSGRKQHHRTAGSRCHCPRFCWRLDFPDSI